MIYRPPAHPGRERTAASNRELAGWLVSMAFLSAVVLTLANVPGQPQVSVPPTPGQAVTRTPELTINPTQGAPGLAAGVTGPATGSDAAGQAGYATPTVSTSGLELPNMALGYPTPYIVPTPLTLFNPPLPPQLPTVAPAPNRFSTGYIGPPVTAIPVFSTATALPTATPSSTLTPDATQSLQTATAAAQQTATPPTPTATVTRTAYP